MHLLRIALCLLLFCGISLEVQADMQQANIQFFTTRLNIEFDDSMLAKNKHCTSTPCVKRFFRKLDESNYQVLLENLQKHKADLELNDWLYYQLIRKSVTKLYPSESDMFHTTTTWFMMTKAGYNTRLLTSKSKFTFLYVQTDDKVFEVPFVKIDGKSYVNLTSVFYNVDTRRIIFEIPRYQPGELRMKSFSFAINQMPDLPGKVSEKTFRFAANDEEITLNLKVDENSLDLLKNFPITNPINYVKVPLAKTTMESLKAELSPHLEGKTAAEQLSLLVSFTRKSFPYKNDQIRYRRDQPLTADQLIFADSSDHEDRCALLYNLVSELTDLNFIVVQYIHDDIITIGVELPEVVGKPFEYEGIQYTICDPTGPKNSSKLGIYPINLDKDIEILDVVNRSID